MNFLCKLQKAINNVDRSYQSVTTCSNNGNVETERERAYCYELYHQLRLEFSSSCYNINGEIDKRGHQIIIDGFNPDIIVHKQGNMNNNEMVLEAKMRWDKEGVVKDFKTLYKMTECYEYKLGVFLYIGKNLLEIKHKLFSLKNEINYNNKMWVMCVDKDNIEMDLVNHILE